MTKTEYTAAITANQAAISAVRADLRKLRNIEKLAKAFPEPKKLVDFDMLDTTIAEKKAELQRLRSELGKARRIVKRMDEIEAIESGKTTAPKAKKSTAEKKAGEKKATEKKTGSKATQTKKQPAKADEGKAKQPTASAEVKENPAA